MGKYYKKDGKVYNLLKCIYLSWMYFLITFTMNNYIGMLHKDVIRTFLTFSFCMFFSYWSHRLSHNNWPIIGLKFMHPLHHNTKYNKKIWAELIEWLINLIQIGGLILIPINIMIFKLFKIKLFNNYSIVLFAIIYTLTHMISYHNLKVNTHTKHHENIKKNFGPDFIDIFFGTKDDNSEFEDHNPYIINSFISFIIVIILMRNNVFS